MIIQKKKFEPKRHEWLSNIIGGFNYEKINNYYDCWIVFIWLWSKNI